MDMEDHKFLFRFVANDWARILLDVKGKGNKEN